MEHLVRSLWRMSYVAQEVVQVLKHRRNIRRDANGVLYLIADAELQAPSTCLGTSEPSECLQRQICLVDTFDASCSGGSASFERRQFYELDNAARLTGQRHFHSQAERRFQASLPTSTNARSRPRRPMKPLSESFTPPSTSSKADSDPAEAPTRSPAPSETQYGVRAPLKSATRTNQLQNSKPTSPTPPQRSPPPSRDSQQQAPRRFGVISPTEAPNWVGSKSGGKNESNGRRNDEQDREQRNHSQRLEVRRGVDPTELEDRMVIKDIKDSTQQPTLRMSIENSGKRVSFGQLLKSRRATPHVVEKTPAPVLEEDFQGLNSTPPPRNDAPRKVPSWKVGLANKEQRQAKAASRDAEPKINEAIRAKTVRLVDPEGQSHEIVSIAEALRRARDAGLDVVEVNAVADPPVCKLVDHKKFKFEAKKKEKARKKQELEQRRERAIKEVRLSSRTDYRDMEMKARSAKEHLALGYQVRCFVQFKKGDRRADIGLQLLPEMLELLKDHGTVNKPPRENSGRLEMFLRPLSLAERKKLPEYKSQASDETEGMAKKKKGSEERNARQTVREEDTELFSEAEELEGRGSEDGSSEENERSEQENEDLDGEEEVEDIEAEEGVGDFDDEISEEEEETDQEISVSEETLATTEADIILEEAAEVEFKDIVDDDLEATEIERSKLELSRRKRWAAQMRRPMQARSTARKKRRVPLEDDEDDEEREDTDIFADEGSSSGSESDDEGGRRSRKRRARVDW